MRVEPEWRDSVAFICERQGSRNVACGTAYFTRVPDELDSKIQWTYLVTARHCIEDSRKTSNGDIFVRVPVVGPKFVKGYEDLPSHADDWFRHKAEHADVAVIPFATEEVPSLRINRMPPVFISKEFEFVPSLENHGAKATALFKEQVRPGAMPVEVGDEVFFPGLFVQSAGKVQLLPVVRFGNIARMPSERISVRSITRGEIEIDAYLTECHSFGGFSGSPV